MTKTGWLGAVLVGALAWCAGAAEPGAAGRQAWVFPVGATVQSSPAVAPDGTIYFGADNGAIYALTPEGKKKWEFRAAGPVVSSPAIGTDGTIYVSATDRIIYALNRDGTEKWRLMPGSGLVSSPAIGSDGAIYVGSVFGQVFAIDPQGYKRWAFPAGGNVVSSPAIGANNTIYFGCYDTNFYAIGTDGARKWMVSTDDKIGSSPAIGPDGAIYFGSYDTFLHVVSPTGERLWEYRTGGAIRSSPVIGKDGTIYIGSDDKKLHAISPEGRRKWEFATEGWIRSTPVIGADGTIHVGSYDGKLYAVGADGVKQWEFATQAAISSSPTIGTNGAIYFGSWDKNFYAVQGAATLAASPWPAFHRNMRRTGSVAPEGVALPPVPPPAAEVPLPVPRPEPEEPKVVLPPVKEPVFTNRVGLPAARFADITATPRDLILSNETIFLKPPPKPQRPPIERIRNDKTKPRIEITSPDEKARFTNPFLVVTGTARDNEGLERVEYRFNSSDILAAEGLGEWTIRLNMPQGQNTMQIRAVDLAGNTSDWITRRFDYIVASPLLIQITGNGDISPNLARDLLEIGKTYTLTAEPARGHAFVRWTGGVNSEKARLDFVMRSNLVLIANFVPKSSAPKEPGEEKQPLPAKVSFDLALEILGQGTVKPGAGRKTIEAGQPVTLTAKPARGHVFKGWKGAFEDRSPEISFVMRTNLALVAEFVPGPFLAAQSPYLGLIWDTNGVSHENSGLINITVNDEGGYKGGLVFGGVAYNLDGKFDEDGQARKMIVRSENRSLMLVLALGGSGNERQLTGAVREQNLAVSFIAARRATSAQSSRYTLLFMGIGSNPGPLGDGCATATLSAAGMIALNGSLSDGTPVEFEGALLPDGRCPVYVPLYGGRGSLSGWLRFGGAEKGLDVQGQLAWFKPESPKEKLYPQGFSRLLTVAGNRYQPPANGDGFLPFSNGVIALSEGNLPELQGNLVELDTRHKSKVVYANDPKFNLNLSPATGSFSGVFVHPVTKKTVPYQGVVLQKLGWGSGHFGGVDQSGLVFFGPVK